MSGGTLPYAVPYQRATALDSTRTPLTTKESRRRKPPIPSLCKGEDVVKPPKQAWIPWLLAERIITYETGETMPNASLRAAVASGAVKTAWVCRKTGERQPTPANVWRECEPPELEHEIDRPSLMAWLQWTGAPPKGVWALVYPEAHEWLADEGGEAEHGTQALLERFLAERVEHYRENASESTYRRHAKEILREYVVSRKGS